MINNNYTTNCATPSFGKFIKIKGSNHKLDSLRQKIIQKKPKYFTIMPQKGKKESVLYLLSGKHYDKFIEIIRKNYDFLNVRLNFEKFMKTKPTNIKIEKAEKKLFG